MKPDQEADESFSKQTKIKTIGGSQYLLVPKEFIEKIGVKTYGDTKVKVMYEEGGYGSYISFWNPVQQTEGGDR